MNKTWVVLFINHLLLVFSSSYSLSEELSEKEAYNIGLNAYLYFYPLVTMDVTRKQMTSVEEGKVPGFGPMNTFANIKAYPTATMRTVVRPNFDTLYSSSWLDLTKGPIILSVPDTNNRYYLLPMLDMWTDVFASPGWRTTGTKAEKFAIIPQSWSGKLPEGVQVIKAPTPYVWVIGRIKTDGPNDYEAVHKIQSGLKISLLEDKGRVSPLAHQEIDVTTAPKEIVEKMSANQFFAYAAELLKVHSPHITDEPMLALLKRIGFESGKSFDVNNLSPKIKESLIRGREAALELMKWKLPSIARVENGWSMNTDTMGVYGNYYLKRAIIAQQGLGANLPEDAIYPLNLFDFNHNALDGNNSYTIHFDKDNLPPVQAFWSITLYDEQGYQVDNSLNRFALSSWMPFKYNEDGSLDLYFSNENPGADKTENWLPAPKGPFNLTMRLYAPKNEALVGSWNPPFVKQS
ncbi:MAG: hypothetical protein BGO10_10180 [Chlamydia sp. 32-24]|nr:MAG: hypothetical protein BGO10_10180 [Chlamydia sp. 32-24]